jgi:hypothetical protein
VLSRHGMNKHSALLDSIQAFYPIACVVIFLPATIAIGHPWIGIVLFIVILRLWKTWWTCVFGLMNAMMLWAGIAGCLVPYIRLLRAAIAQ